MIRDTGKTKCKQIVSPPETIRQIIQSLHDDPCKSTLAAVKFYTNSANGSSRLTSLNFLQNVSNCQNCIRSKPIQKLQSHLHYSRYTHVLTACDYVSRFLLAIPVRKPDTRSVEEALMQISTQLSNVP